MTDRQLIAAYASFGLVLIFAVITGLYASGRLEFTKPNLPPPTVTTIAKIHQDYTKNSFRANETWHGQRLEVTGRLTKFGAGLFGRPQFTLTDPTTVVANGLTTPQIELRCRTGTKSLTRQRQDNPNHQAKQAQDLVRHLNVGQTVTVRGHFQQRNGQLTLRHCYPLH